MTRRNTSLRPLIAALLALAAPLLCAQQEIAEPREPESYTNLPHNPYAPGVRGDQIIPITTLTMTNLEEVAQTLERLTGKTILRSTGFPPVNVNFTPTSQRLTLDETVLALESLLSLNGIAIISMGQFMKAVPAQALAYEAPEIINGSTLPYPPSLKFYTKIFRLNYLDAEKEAAQLIGSFTNTSKGGPLVRYPKSNVLVVTDTLMSLQRIELILEQADRPDNEEIVMIFIPLKNIAAADVQRQLDALLLRGQTPLTKYFANNTSIEADERTNQLIVITHPSNEARIRELVESVDKDVEPRTVIEKFPIKNAVATEVETVLTSLISSQQDAAREAAGRNAPNTAVRNRNVNIQRQTQPGQANAQAQVTADAAGGSGDNLSFSEFVQVVADERSNSVFATGTKTDIKLIGELVEKIDVQLPQVVIEVLIAEVILDEGMESGIDAFNVNYDSTTDLVSLPQTSVGTGLTASNVLLPTAGPFLEGFTIDMLISQAESNSNTEILSAPIIMATHNREAIINVSEQRPLVTGTTVSDGVSTQNVDFRDVGIQLTVTPLIGDNEVIQLEINQTIDQFGAEVFTIDGNDQPNILRREATSYVTIFSGQTIVLGGLRSREVRDNEGRLFLLGDLPLIGSIFQPEDHQVSYRELIIFIRPVVIVTPKGYKTETATADEISDSAIDGLNETGDTIREFYRDGDFPYHELPPYDPLNLKKALGARDTEPREKDEDQTQRHGPRR